MVISRAQKAHVELLGVWLPGALEALETELAVSPLSKVVTGLHPQFVELQRTDRPETFKRQRPRRSHVDSWR